ncbi:MULTISPECIES: glutathione S-transferase N-terminal domain-containing protein [unclassified Moraxella]|uniref:glutathione S-transferase N-terminal domain-containing protein n=1 Tax=unclassified Moraxella TaxID=2685852 RepID=UPI003AF4A82F
MKLFVSTTSPYSRLLMIACHLHNIDLPLVFVMPWDNPVELLTANPFSQVPALLTDDGTLITETSVILAYLLPQIFSDPKTASLSSLSFGIISQAVRAFATQRFQPKNSLPHPFIERSSQLLRDMLPNAPQLDAESMDLPQIFYGVALVYVKMRLPDLYKQAVSDNNQQAVNVFLQRDFMQKTDSQQLELHPKSTLQILGLTHFHNV